MAAGDIDLGETTQGDGSLIGAAKGVTIADPGLGSTTTLLTNDLASFVAAVEAGTPRIIGAAGLQFDLTDLVEVGAGMHYIVPDGKTDILGDALGNEPMFSLDVDDVFMGNILFRPGLGLNSPSGNNVHAAINTTSATQATGVYHFGCYIQTDAGVSSMPGDEPEGFSRFNGSAVDNVCNVTYHCCGVVNEEAQSKAWLQNSGSGGFGTGSSNTSYSMYRCYSFAGARSPLLGDAILADLINFVWPEHTGATQQGGEIRRGGKMNLVAAYIHATGASAQDWSAETLGSVEPEIYYVTSGGGDDNSLEGGTPTFLWDGANPYSTSRFTPAAGAEITPLAMTTALRDIILAETAGTYPIFFEAPAGTLTPVSAARAAYLSFTENGFRDFFTKLEPYEKRFRDSIHQPYFYRWNDAAKTKVKEWTADWTGLNPHASRSRLYIPAQKQFGGA